MTFLMAILPGTALAQRPLWGELQPGPYAVGLRLTTHVDTSRSLGPFDTEAGGRPIEIATWYPAADPADDSMHFRDYVRLLPGVGPEADTRVLRDWLGVAVSGSVDAIASRMLDRILAAPTAAVRDATPRAGPSPLVLWTTRHETVVAQSVLAEYLASHGYVVAAARYAGPPLPMPWALETAQQGLDTFAAHLGDLEFALATLETEPFVDRSRVAVLTWSYATELAPRLQMAHDNVRLVVGLSSNPLSMAGPFQGDLAAAVLDPQRLRVPYVIMSEEVAPDGQLRQVPTILDQLPAVSYSLWFTQLAHGNFNAVEGMIPGVFELDAVHSWSRGGTAARRGYEAVARGVRAFLDHHVAPAASRELDRHWMEQLPEGYVTFRRHGPGTH